MIEYYIRKHTLYKVAIAVLIVSACALVYAIYMNVNALTLCLLFVLQIAVVSSILMKAIKEVIHHYHEEWDTIASYPEYAGWKAILDDDVDPKKLIEKYQKDEKLQTFTEARANCAVYYYLAGDQTSAKMMIQDILATEKKLAQQAMFHINLAAFYEAEDDIDMSKQELASAKEELQKLEKKKIYAGSVFKMKNRLKMLEMYYAYKDHAISDKEYEVYLKKMLKQEKTNRGKLQQHYRLAILYMDQEQLGFARDEVNQVIDLGRKTYMAEKIQLKLRALEDKEGLSL